MRNIFAIWRIRRLKILTRENKALEKQIDLQQNLNELLKEENEIQQKATSDDK